MAVEFELPELGEGVVEGEIVEWHVKPGDRVDHDMPLVSMLTDKATVEISATFTGVIAMCRGESGDSIAVGSVLLTYNAEGEEPAQPETAPKNTGQAGQAGQAQTARQPGSEIDFPLPEIGEGVIEGEIVEWHVRGGDTVEMDQPVVSILTDKATVEITAPAPGKVISTKGEPGEVLKVGEAIMRMWSSEPSAAPAKSAATAREPERATAETATATADVASAGVVAAADNPSISAFGTPLTTPAVRRLAVKHGIDLRTVRGTGPKHRITRADVERAAQGGRAPTPPAAAQPAVKAVAIGVTEGEKREKIKGLRKAIHASMTRSKSIVPHFTYVDEIEMDQLVALRNQLKDPAAAQGIKLTYLPFITKAVVFALKKFPILNASVDDEAGEIVYKADYNIGIATATPAGLTVPVLKHADRKTVLEMAKEMVEITDRARNKRSTMEDISGGTFTITSLGRIGGLLATPIINYPEVGIMGIHNLQERAVVRDGQIVIRQMMNLSLSFDHRVVDGDVGASFAQEVKSYLEAPGKLLLHMT